MLPLIPLAIVGAGALALILKNQSKVAMPTISPDSKVIPPPALILYRLPPKVTASPHPPPNVLGQVYPDRALPRTVGLVTSVARSVESGNFSGLAVGATQQGATQTIDAIGAPLGAVAIAGGGLVVTSTVAVANDIADAFSCVFGSTPVGTIPGITTLPGGPLNVGGRLMRIDPSAIGTDPALSPDPSL